MNDYPISIVLMKLVTGEEIVAKKVGAYEYEKPRVLALTPVGPGQMGATLMPWIIGNPDGKFSIGDSHIVTTSYNVPKNLEDTYLQNTSGIQLING